MPLIKKIQSVTMNILKLGKKETKNLDDRKICCHVCHKCFTSTPKRCYREDCPYQP